MLPEKHAEQHTFLVTKNCHATYVLCETRSQIPAVLMRECRDHNKIMILSKPYKFLPFFRREN